jgi:type II secretory pathway component GspD/PulD (secretin)
MNIKVVLWLLILFCGSNLKDDTIQTTEVGREDPFAQLPTSSYYRTEKQIVDGNSKGSPEPMFVQTVTLKFLSAKNLELALKGMSSKYGSIIADETNNTVIVCDAKENVSRIVQEIKKADQTPQQIMVEVVIADVKIKNDTEVGVNIDQLFEDERNLVTVQRTIDPSIGTNINTPGGVFGISNDSLKIFLHALQQKENVEILASPRVMVLSGYNAEIKTVEQIPYSELTQTSQGGQINSTEFKEVGITLKVKATLTENRKIMMLIQPEQSAQVGQAPLGEIPIIDTRSATTTLLMNDGQVMIMGGLKNKEIRKIKTQVPLLGNLPLIGFLFSGFIDQETHSELLVFISPHIYKGNEVSADQMAKFQELHNRPMLKIPAKTETEILLNK